MTPDVVRLEEEGWRALARGGWAARDFYDEVLDERVVMLLPGGRVLDDRETILHSLSGPRWEFYNLDQLLVLEPADGVAVVVYAVSASRPGQPCYRAEVSSTYVQRPDGWKLALHQQTPR